MGLRFSRMMAKWFGKDDRRLLLLGLDAAGKSTVLYRLRLKKTVNTIPTVGFNVETVKFKKMTLNIWDVGGQDRLRPYWRHYFTGTHGVIFVVDSADRARMEIAKREFISVISDDQLTRASILVLANKQDQAGCMTPVELGDFFSMEQVCSGHQWHVAGTCAKTGEGLEEAFSWIGDNMGEV